MVQAGFFYGEYDGLQSPLEFELHIGVNVKLTIRLLFDSARLPKVIVAAQGNIIWVWLINKQREVPNIDDQSKVAHELLIPPYQCVSKFTPPMNALTLK